MDFEPTEINWVELSDAVSRLKNFSENSHVIIYPEFWSDLDIVLDSIEKFTEDLL